MVFGRVSTEQRDVIKQSMLAVSSFAYANLDENFSKGDPYITVCGFNESEIGQVNSELKTFASNISDRKINVKGYKYTNSREKVWESLRCHSVCMMLSLHEGFGLAGWEAISAGVPLIISENSGLYELLHQKQLHLKVCSLSVSGDLAKKEFSKDINNVASYLIVIRENIKAYKNNAIELREALLNEGFTWENTASTFLRAIQIETKEESKFSKFTDLILKKIKSIPEFGEIPEWQRKEIINEFLKCQKYSECSSSLEDLTKDIKRGKIINVLGIHCSTFCPDANNYVANLLYNDNTISVRILSACPTSNHLLERLLTIEKYRDHNEELKLHYQQLCETAKIFRERKGYNTRFFNSTPYFRLYLTTDSLFFSCYRDGVHAKYEEVFRFGKTTEMYKIFSKYYEYVWRVSSSELHIDEQDLPTDKKHLLLEWWNVKPSLVINVCSKCNMECQYCPEGGENLVALSDEQYCPEPKLVLLTRTFLNYNVNKVIRITGGEPLINRKIRQTTMKIMQASSGYEKIILCTNGVYIKDAYDENKNLWEYLKSKILLKISLDTLNPQSFRHLTGCEQETLLRIIDGIKFMRQRGFLIELNVVVKKDNAYEIPALFEFAKIENLIGIKVLTVNDFGGRIAVSSQERDVVTEQLNEIMKQMRQKGFSEQDVSLHDGAGIVMKRYYAKASNGSDCTLTIVDHNVNNNSITPRRTFCENCSSCEYYPCATGLLNLTVRADGMLSYCRLRMEKAISIKGLNNIKMKLAIEEMLKPFSKCSEGLV